MATGLSRAIAVGVKSKVSLAVLATLLATGGAAGVTAAAAGQWRVRSAGQRAGAGL